MSLEDKSKKERATNSLEKSATNPVARSETAPAISVDRLKSTEATPSARAEKLADCKFVAAAERGKFLQTCDNRRRVTSVEGWLSHSEGPRSSSDSGVQDKFRTKHKLNETQDAYHLIAHAHGGPNVERHGRLAADRNLVAADSRINRSHHKIFENQLTRDLAVGKQIYCRVDVYYKDEKSRHGARAEYRYFTPGEDGKLEPYTVPSYQVRLGEEVNRTARQTAKEHGVPDFYKHSFRPGNGGNRGQVH